MATPLATTQRRKTASSDDALTPAGELDALCRARIHPLVRALATAAAREAHACGLTENGQFIRSELRNG